MRIRAASLQFVRKLSGFARPSQANADAFDRAVDEVAVAARRLVDSLVTSRRRGTAKRSLSARGNAPRNVTRAERRLRGYRRSSVSPVPALLPDVFVEPLEVVLHDRAARLRLRWTVADALEALIDDQLRRHPHILQPLIELVRVRQRHALVGGAVLDQRRRLAPLM